MMGTPGNGDNLAASLFGKTRRSVLSLLYSHSDQSFHLRHILRVAGSGHGAAQRELRQLSDAGIVTRTVKGKQVYYQANTKCPIFPEIKSLIMKTAGVVDLLRSALAPIAEGINFAFVYGSLAQGQEKSSSDVDVLIVGSVSFAEIIEKLQSAQEALGREVNPTVYPPAEFQSKIIQKNHFLTNILGKNKLFLIGDDYELNRLVEQRLVDRT